jgi:hypothetical protein
MQHEPLVSGMARIPPLTGPPPALGLGGPVAANSNNGADEMLGS